MKKVISALAAICLAAMAQEAVQIPEGWFPFTVDARVLSSDSLASVDFLNPSKATERIQHQSTDSNSVLSARYCCTEWM